MSQPLHARSLADLSRLMAEGATTSEAIVSACLERIREREPEIQAWASLDPDKALAQARGRDREARRSALHGLPIGIKDVFETVDWPTEYGSKVYAGHRPARDAAVVAFFKAAGAVILGKTVTTEFAAFHPNVTRNPRNPAHTPGGSSSGSAAAVADGMVPAATGTQTMGSVIRPAAYCGIVGYKPSFNLVPTAGVQEEAPSLDTVGFLVRAVADLPLLMDAAARHVPGGWQRPLGRPPRLGIVRGPSWKEVEPATVAAIDHTATLLEKEGASVEEVPVPSLLEDLHAAARTVLRYEAPRMWAYEGLEKLELMSPPMQRFVRDAEINTGDFIAALQIGEAARAWLAETMAERRLDAFLTAAAPGEAPFGLETTGSATLNQAWTMSHAPCITLPCGTGPSGLPVGVQLVGPRYEDAHLIGVAAWAEPRLVA